ncbi:hypothetical protein [Streptomyces sp. JV185]|uniref:hypothetical protein n=1 Tax=Streptomyces sp. JV185 TaxID=858638 RepID=UPI002E79C7C8|nr:hypothetical protein [Streptomyces sp. JV185]
MLDQARYHHPHARRATAEQAMARALLREPDLVNHMGEQPGVRSLCIHCNQCMPTICTGTHRPIAGPPPGRPSRLSPAAADDPFRATE